MSDTVAVHTARRVVWEYDQDADLSHLEQDEFSDVDPSSIVSLVAIAQAQCECCGSWVTTDSLGGIDLMADDRFELGEMNPDHTTLVGQGWHPEQIQIAGDLRFDLPKSSPR